MVCYCGIALPLTILRPCPIMPGKQGSGRVWVKDKYLGESFRGKAPFV
jgi:hypothetical protein